MPSKKEVKRLNKDLVLTIDWVAAEYKYVKELQQDIEKIRTGKEPLKNLRKASKILHYISRAERRASRFEWRVRTKIEELGKEEFALTDIIKAIREIAKELDVEQAHLVNYSSFYDGLLEKELNRAAAEEQLEEEIRERNPQKAQQIHAAFLQLVYQIEYQIKDAERWISALEGSLKKAKELLEENRLKIAGENKEGLDILHRYYWPLKDTDPGTIFLAQYPDDLKMLAKTMGTEYSARFKGVFFIFGLLAVVELLVEEKVTWEQVVKDLLHISKTIGNGNLSVLVFVKGFSKVKGLITKENWPIFSELLPQLALREDPNSLRDDLKSFDLSPFIRTFGNKYLEILLKLHKAGVLKYFPNNEEICSLVKFIGELRREVFTSKIDFVYSVDRSGRILGFLFYHVLKKLGESRNIKFYFIYATNRGVVTFYSEKQKKEIVGKKVLVIDEYVSTGTTMDSIKSLLSTIVGPGGEVVLYAFAIGSSNPSDRFHGSIYKTHTPPTWYYKKEYSGMQEKPHGGVEVNKGAQEIARGVRKSLLVLAEVIADYLK